MNINVSTAYSGEVLQSIIAKASLGNEVAEKQIIHIVPNVQKKFAIPRMQVNGTFLQKRKSRIAIDGTDSKGDIIYDERYLDPADLMVYTEFNPATFESVWRPFQPTGNLVFQQLPADVQTKMLDLILKKVGSEMGDNYINCIKGSGDGQFFNGIVARVLGDKDTKYAKGGETTWAKRLANLYDAIPAEIVDNPALKIVMNTLDYNAYANEITEQMAKNVDITKSLDSTFNGLQIVRLAKWPRGLAMATLCSLGEDSNLWAAVNLESDENAVLIDRVNNASDIYFVKILLKADVNTAFGEFVAISDDREQGVATLSGSVITSVGKASTYSQDAALSADVTYSISTTGAVLGQTCTVKNNQTAAKKITIGGVDINKGESKTFHYAINADGNLEWIA